MSVPRLVLFVGLSIAAGCFTERTDYRSGELVCSHVGSECPAGLRCAGDNHCYRPGDGPPDAPPAKDAPIGPVSDGGCVASGDPCGARICGFVTDTCGRTVLCGPLAGLCPGSLACDGTGQCVTNCVPVTTCPTAADCGSIDKGCGLGPLSCGGNCPATKPLCVANVCTCVLQTCPANSCGSYSNGCGGFLSCGGCMNNQTCDLGLCRDKTLAEACTGLGCGNVTSGGSTYTCPPGCVLPQTCQGAGVPNVCGCTPTRNTCPPAATCGTVDDGCGHPIRCGPDSCTGTGATCGGGGTPNQCGCTDNGQACAGGPCDSAINNCGDPVTCGPICSPCETCTASGCADPQGCCCSGHYCECHICVPEGDGCP